MNQQRMASSRRTPKPSPMKRMSHGKWRTVLEAFEVQLVHDPRMARSRYDE